MSQNDVAYFSVVDATGIILRSGTCLASDLPLQAQDGATVVETEVELDDTEWVYNHAEQSFEELPLAPGPWAVWTGSEWTDPRTQADLDAALAADKAQAKAQITAVRGQARLAYITDLPGQDMLLTAKLEEARAYIADANPDPANYPLVMSEVGITAPTAYEVAQVFLNLNAMWRAAAGSLDAACFQAEAAVDAAPDETTIETIIGNLAAALESIA